VESEKWSTAGEQIIHHLPLSTLHFEVQDTGPGIAPEHLEAVFDPFVQSASGQKSKEGTGLGLGISRQFTRLMGGLLVAASEGVPGLGAVFTLDIPVRLTEAADLAGLEKAEGYRVIGLEPGQRGVDGAPFAARPYRLLVAEDRAESRQLLVKLLTDWGFQVRAARDGLEAVNLWKEWQPHLIWMDMRMPVMDGHEATRRIKAESRGKSTVIIALTASAFEEDRDQVLAEGCDDFVRKPFRQDEIADKLVKHLGVRFIYEGTREPDETGAPQTPLDLTGLPAEWVASLRQAAIEADASKLTALADSIREQRPNLAQALKERVSNFDYAAILDALSQCDTGERA